MIPLMNKKAGSKSKKKAGPYREFKSDLKMPFESKPIMEQVSEMFRLKLIGFKSPDQVSEQITTRYVKVVDHPNPEAVIKENLASFKQIKCCKPKNLDDKKEYQPGDLLEVLEENLTIRLTTAQTAIKNWSKVKMRIQIMQAFGMLH
jgi:hypothetical protein